MVKRKISELKPAEYNPREIDEFNQTALKKSIKQFGQVRDAVINTYPTRENVIISGHQLVKAMIDLGMEEIECTEVNIDEAKEKALNLALNKVSGTFEEQKLIDMISNLNDQHEDVIGLTGFKTEEIIYLLGIQEKDKQKMFAKSAEDEFNKKNKYGIEPGDIVKLDDHLIICGDSTDPDNFKKLIGDKKADMVVTSPPYNLDIFHRKYRDNKELKEYLNMMEQIFLNLKDFLSSGRFVCINIGREWGPINMPSKYDQLLDACGYTFFRNIYWSKPKGAARGTITTRNPFPRYYVPKVQTEIIQVYSTDPDPLNYDLMLTYKFKEGEKVKQEQIPNLLLDKYSGNVWEMMTETTLSADHPAPFPVQLPFNCIRFFSFEGEKIIDPFAGSLSTLLACEQLKRKFIGVELDPNYISFGIERYLIMFPNGKLEITKVKQDKKF